MFNEDIGSAWENEQHILGVDKGTAHNSVNALRSHRAAYLKIVKMLYFMSYFAIIFLSHES